MYFFILITKVALSVVWKTVILCTCSHWRTQGAIEMKWDHFPADRQMFYTKHHPLSFFHKRAADKPLEKRYLFFYSGIKCLEYDSWMPCSVFSLTGTLEVPCLLLSDIGSIDYHAFLLSECVEVADGDSGSLPWFHSTLNKINGSRSIAHAAQLLQGSMLALECKESSFFLSDMIFTDRTLEQRASILMLIFQIEDEVLFCHTDTSILCRSFVWVPNFIKMEIPLFSHYWITLL